MALLLVALSASMRTSRALHRFVPAHRCLSRMASPLAQLGEPLDVGLDAPPAASQQVVEVLPVASKLVIIDGHALAYRMHFALSKSAMKTVRGEETHILHGFLSKMLDLHGRFPGHKMVVAFDLPGPTFRAAELASYKASRPAMPIPLRTQLPLINEACGLLGCPTLSAEGFEADDVIAACVREATAQGASDVVIVAMDKDLLQLVATDATSPTRVTMWHDKQKVAIDAAAVAAKHGVQPRQMADLLALMGDASDDVPGVPGIGPKNAAKLLCEYGDLEGVLAAAVGGAMRKGKKTTALIESAEIARRARRLVTLAEDAPIDARALGAGSLVFDHPELSAFLRHWELGRVEHTISTQRKQAAARAAPAGEAAP